MNDDARDPYVGLNDYFGRKAAGAVPAWYAVGRVISTTPLKIRADGLDLDIEDLYIAQHLTAGFAFSRRHTDHDVVAATKVLQHWLFKTGFLQCITHYVNFSRFFERNFDNRTTGEIQPPVKAAHAHNNDSGD